MVFFSASRSRGSPSCPCRKKRNFGYSLLLRREEEEEEGQETPGFPFRRGKALIDADRKQASSHQKKKKAHTNAEEERRGERETILFVRAFSFTDPLLCCLRLNIHRQDLFH